MENINKKHENKSVVEIYLTKGHKNRFTVKCNSKTYYIEQRFYQEGTKLIVVKGGKLPPELFQEVVSQIRNKNFKI